MFEWLQTMDWKVVAFGLGGMLLMRLCQWAGKWFDDKGAEFVKAELQKLGEKLNQNSILSQIQADDACIKIVENALTVVIPTLGKEVAALLSDGKITAEERKAILATIWAEAEPQIKGGANDYLKQSSFADAKVLVELVIKRFFAKKKAEAPK
jgi:hypothetical protein